MLAMARGGELGAMQFLLNRVPAAMPAKAESILNMREEASPLLELSLSGLLLNCHFFDHGEIEFDFDPREMTDDRLISLMAWLRKLGTRLSKDVIVTNENDRRAPLVIYQHQIDRLLVVGKIDKQGWEQ